MQLENFKHDMDEGVDFFFCTFGLRLDKDQMGRLLKYLDNGGVDIVDLQKAIHGDTK